MKQNFVRKDVNFPQQRPMLNGRTVLKAIGPLQKLNNNNVCTVKNLKKYQINQHEMDRQVLDANIRSIMKMVLDQNILKDVGDTGKVIKCRKRKKSPEGNNKRKKSSGGNNKRKKLSRDSNQQKISSGGIKKRNNKSSGNKKGKKSTRGNKSKEKPKNKSKKISADELQKDFIISANCHHDSPMAHIWF